VDWNCNGIYGVNSETGNSWEQDLCEGVQQYGVAYIGDSAGAHFHIPPSYMNASAIQLDTFQNLVEILANEFDWPQMSTGTGYENSTWMGAPKLDPLGENSWYQQFLDRNRCMFRDYQNICVNGARVSSIAENIIPSFRRNQTADLPMVVGFALIGNDVCNWRHSYDHFTNASAFKASVLQSLDYLDSVLPPGSHVSTFGLANGSMLYDNMHDRVHPLGDQFPSITYEVVYDYLNCLEVSPCWGWLNSNQTVRQYTDQYAAMLSGIYDEVISEYGNSGRWKNFKLFYWPLAFNDIITEWQASGGQVWELIEPIDGFHPSQQGMTLLAEYHIKKLQEVAPELLPPINPNNARIASLFGDQGGY
jgi:acyloxyacyl hydrolase